MGILYKNRGAMTSDARGVFRDDRGNGTGGKDEVDIVDGPNRRWQDRPGQRPFSRLDRLGGQALLRRPHPGGRGGHHGFQDLRHPRPAAAGTQKRDPDAQRRTGQPPPDLVFTDDPPAQLLARLASEGHAEAILAGGARINSLFAAEHLIDEIIVTISPRLFGSGLSLFDTSLDLSLQLLEVRRLDADLVLLNYRVIR